jgi:rhodanese-related sulfurtransferase
MKLHNAIFQLNPAIKVIRGEEAFDEAGNLVAYDKAAAEALVAANQYKVQRAAEYPSFAEQFDLLYHGGMEAWKSAIQAVKDRYPKP